MGKEKDPQWIQLILVLFDTTDPSQTRLQPIFSRKAYPSIEILQLFVSLPLSNMDQLCLSVKSRRYLILVMLILPPKQRWQKAVHPFHWKPLFKTEDLGQSF